MPAFYVLDATYSKKLDAPSVLRDFEQWLGKQGAIAAAVRSSSDHEDGTDQSFAGQFATILDVRNGKAYVEALRTVFASKQSAAYAETNSKVNAIVQVFVEADVSGVAFSINPANGNNEFVINAAPGRGTNVVDGQKTEQYFVDRLHPERFTTKSDGPGSVLTGQTIRELTELVLQIETLFMSPQDIEWCIKDGVIYILQARPITRISHLRLWDSSNIAESFPGIVLPLTFSIAKRGYLLGYKAQAYAAGLSWYDLEAHHRTFDSMVGIFNGKMYYNLLSWYQFIALFPGAKRNQKFLDDQIATQGEAVYQIPIPQTLRYKVGFGIRALYRTLFFQRELNQFYQRFARFESELERLPQHGDTQLLMEQYGHIEQTIIPHFGRTVDNDFLVMTYHGWLKRCLTKWLPPNTVEQTNIIGSVSGVLSAEQALSLYRLAASIKDDANAHALLQNKQYKQLDTYLADIPLQQQITEYLETFGHRFAEDQKLEAINPTLKPHGIYELLHVYAQLDSAAVQKRLSTSLAASKTSETAIERQLTIVQKIVYRLLLRRLKHHLRIREKNRLLRGKVYGYMRALFPKVGRALVVEKVVDVWDDVYYLQIEEIFQLMQGTVIVNDLADRVTARKAAYKRFADIDMPDRFITKQLPSIETITSAPTQSTSVSNSLTGLISSPGTVEGRVVVLSEPVIPKEPYDILVAKHTDPGWTPLIALAKGVIVEHGGMLSHAAIVTRELGIPSIIGVENVTTHLKTGMLVRINTQTSAVEVIES